MKITYTQKNKKGFREINLYRKDSEKKYDFNDSLFTNIKIPDNLNRRSFVIFVRTIIKRVKTHKLENISINYDQIRGLLNADISEKECAELFIKNILLATYSFDHYKSKKESTPKKIAIIGALTQIEKTACTYATLLANNISIARDLANTPANDMTPAILANNVKKIFKGAEKTKIKILEEKDIKTLKMNLMAAVGQGSASKSKFIIIEYKNGKSSDKPVILVGKGVTFDAGGLDIKPAGKFQDMYMDMTGATIAIGTLKTLIDIKAEKNVIALLPVVENAVSGNAYRPGDIITSMSGKTVAIGNTDAEGRLIMADTITYAERYQPTLIIDIATLTGASLAALGQHATAFMTKTQSLQDSFIDISGNVCEYIWPLPTWDIYTKDLDHPYADISNIGKTRYGGTITAGMFLYQFIKMHKKIPQWIHLDIAPRMESIESDNLAKGATGEPIGLLVEYLKRK